MDRNERIKHIVEMFESFPEDVRMALIGGITIEALSHRKEEAHE